MTYDNYRMIFMIATSLGVLFFIISVILFVVLKIPRVVGDLTGITERKAIKLIRLQNEKATEEAELNQKAISQKPLTDKITLSGRIVQRNELAGEGMKTEKIDSAELNNKNTTVLRETVLLNDSGIESNRRKSTTEILEINEQIDNKDKKASLKNNKDFDVEYEITFINTDEIIL